MIVILDYGLGNVLSVSKAFEEVAGANNVIVSRVVSDIDKASHIVLPGVGNFKTGMENLKKHDLITVLKQSVLKEKKPFLGICLGLQLLAERGEEDGDTKGLGFIPGKARLLDSQGMKMPHIGWDDVQVISKKPLFRNIAGGREYYFVHSYCLECPDEYVVATCSYGEPFPAVIQKDNIFATQFHPEKSRDQGLRLLKNFVEATC